MPPIITLEDVAVDRTSVFEGKPRTLRILSGVQVAIPRGGRLAIIGPSGAGKTSLLRLFNRLDDPVLGRLTLDGQDLRQIDPIALRRRVGMVFQQPFLFPLTVMENLAYPLRLINRQLTHAEAEALLGEFALPADFLSRSGQQLSGGQQQRVAVARALALRPEALLLDEPTSALDEESAGVMLAALLQRNAEAGLTLIMVTHSPDVLRRFQGEVLLLRDGRAELYPDAESALGAVDRAKIRME
ncbi:MAG TPA: ATP-binding cassette domain-containing protein [Armatimonadota bacterium]|jgi:putative ABC transport system ATP-binding protein